jgi:putative glutamine amidotransferase
MRRDRLGAPTLFRTHLRCPAMTRPIIGITTYGRDDQDRYALPTVYVDCVTRAGGIAVLIPPAEEDVQPLLDRLQGVILAGGGDMDPALYGGRCSNTIYMVDPQRDRCELALVRAVLQKAIPCLGICRGIQVINVALGGTLVEHLPEEVGETVLHRAPPRQPVEHAIYIQPESRLAKIMGRTRITCASWHHQAIRGPGQDLQVVARAPDGTIEAVEMTNHPWLFGIQWHPELTAAEDPLQQKLFQALNEAARKKRAAGCSGQPMEDRRR